MITLFSGVPGSGKTLRVVSELKKLRDAEAGTDNVRPIYTNIDGLSDALGCALLEDPRGWFNLPPGSLVVIDECQRVFPPRGSATAVPEYVQRFDTHRHDGLDVWLITQHPKLIDNFVRLMVGKHHHGYRPFGMAHAVWSSWEQCNDNPATATKPLQETVKYDASVFGLYRSAEIHTHKRQLPWKKLTYIGGLFLLVAAVGWYAFGGLQQLSHGVAGPGLQAGAGTDDRASVLTAATAQPILTAIPAEPAAPAVPVLQYQGWQRLGDRIDFFLCLPRAVATENGASRYDGCATAMLWSEVRAYRRHGARIEILDDSGEPFLAVQDPSFILDAQELGVAI